MDEKNIYDALLKSGWKDNEIKEVIKHLKSENISVNKNTYIFYKKDSQNSSIIDAFNMPINELKKLLVFPD